ncbi:MAG: DUF87 domain-containing protein, partial [Bdellovibrionales bacterium]|nr:DUF87 domain-containing protein [Bdellovibrionales bacterium]
MATYLDMRFGSISTLVNIMQDLQDDEQVVYQLVMKGTKDNAYFNSKIKTMKAKAKFLRSLSPKYWFKKGIIEKLEEAIEHKSNQRLFQANLRIAFAKRPNPEIGLEGDVLKKYLSDVMDNFGEAVSVWNKTDQNYFVWDKYRYGSHALRAFQAREISKSFLVYNVEAASMWFPPSSDNVQRTKRVLFNRAPLPQSIPTKVEDSNNCLFGQSNYRSDETKFGLNRIDRRGHCYILGKSGSGKSYMLQLLVKADMQFGHGLAVLDPHGDLVDDILKIVPEHRVKDVIVLDPSDYQFPPSFNPLARVPDELKMRVTIGIVEIFQKLLGSTWSDRLEHVLRYTTLSLLSTRGTTILSIRRMLVDERYRLMVASNIEDNVLRSFWLQ